MVFVLSTNLPVDRVKRPMPTGPDPGRARRGRSSPSVKGRRVIPCGDMDAIIPWITRASSSPCSLGCGPTSAASRPTSTSASTASTSASTTPSTDCGQTSPACTRGSTAPCANFVRTSRPCTRPSTPASITRSTRCGGDVAAIKHPHRRRVAGRPRDAGPGRRLMCPDRPRCRVRGTSMRGPGGGQRLAGDAERLETGVVRRRQREARLRRHVM